LLFDESLLHFFGDIILRAAREGSIPIPVTRPVTDWSEIRAPKSVRVIVRRHMRSSAGSAK
jgi:hypothetical protein